jgi:hypothetical protein
MKVHFPGMSPKRRILIFWAGVTVAGREVDIEVGGGLSHLGCRCRDRGGTMTMTQEEGEIRMAQ